MKYKYSKFSFYFQCIFVVVFSFSLLYYMYFNYGDIRFLKRTGVTITGVLAVWYMIYSPEYIKRFVEFHDNYVVFNSFRIPRKGVKSFNVKYEDILRLDATVIPIIGIYKVKVKCNNVPWNIPVTWCMSHHNELFSKLCSYAKGHNPNVSIDERLIEILEKKGYRETD